MAIKKIPSMLPPKRAAKREFGVNVRFTHEEHDVLQQVAIYRNMTITELVYYVVGQVALPQLVDEMNEEQIAESTPAPTPPATEPPVQSPMMPLTKAIELSRPT